MKKFIIIIIFSVLSIFVDELRGVFLTPKTPLRTYASDVLSGC